MSTTATATPVVVILGSLDPEMNAIESLARGAGFTVEYAATPAGRVRPGQLATGRLTADGYREGAPAIGCQLILVEVPRGGAMDTDVTLADLATGQHAFSARWLDHHGDAPQADYPPAAYMEASSLGQFIGVLALAGKIPANWERTPTFILAAPGGAGVGEYLTADCALDADVGVVVGAKDGYAVVATVPPELTAIAAADHCLAAAYAGACPGADLRPGSIGYVADMEATRLAFLPSVPASEFLGHIEEARRTLREAPALADMGVGLGGLDIADLRGLAGDWGPATPTGERFPRRFPCGPRVAAIEGRSYLVQIEAAHGPALRLGGFDGGNPVHRAAIVAWLGMAGEAYGCLPASAPPPTNLYGFPARGMGGGTLRPA